jgi:hypothetical protein
MSPGAQVEATVGDDGAVVVDFIWGGFPWPFFIATSGFFACILAENVVADVLTRRSNNQAQQGVFGAMEKEGSSNGGTDGGLGAADLHEPLLGPPTIAAEGKHVVGSPPLTLHPG